MRLLPSNGFILHDETSRRIEDIGMAASSGEKPRVAMKAPTVKTVVEEVAPTPEAPRPAGYREKCRARVQNDELGKIIAEQSDAFDRQDWDDFIHETRQRGDLLPTPQVTQGHPAGNLISHLAKLGTPAIMSTAPWGESELEHRLKRGSHKSCDEHLDFLRGEMLEFVRKRFWVLLPYRLIRKKLRRKIREMHDFRVSPLGIVPQRDRRPRLIVDYSYYEVNQDTLQLGPKDSMQFGRTLERILYQVRHANPLFGPVYLGKVDLADGFYRVWLTPGAIPKLAVAFPRYAGEEQLVALPMALPMGWVESVPYFCAVTETVADIANAIPSHVQMPRHPLEDLANTPPPMEELPVALAPATTAWQPQEPPLALAPTTSGLQPEPPPVKQDLAPQGQPVLRPFHKPVKFNDIYVDDYILGLQGSKKERLQHLRRLLHSIDEVFRPVDALDSADRNHVASVKKFLKGDACLSTRKVVLGWIIDTLRGTLELPPHRIARLQEIFDYLRGRDRVGIAKWRKFLGELRSMSLGIPGSRGLFSMLQEGLKYTDQDRIKITPEIKDQLLDFEFLTRDLGSRPTAIAELVPDHPVAIGPHDASGMGMGGVWLPAVSNSNLDPVLWRARFPQHITANLVSYDNPNGTINNSELELAGLVGHQDILQQEVNCTGRTVVPLSDNTPTVAWHHKGSTSTTGPTAYLLRLNSLHQRHFRYLAKADYIAGPVNKMADDCSRLWHLSDSQLLAYFNSMYPQKRPWKLVHLRPEMHSALTLALQKQRPEPLSFLGALAPKMATGAHGRSSLPLTRAWTPTSLSSGKPPSYIFSKFSPQDCGEALSHPAVSLSGVDRWRSTYGPSERRSPWWTTRTHGTTTRESSTLDLTAYKNLIRRPTLHPSV